jgi:hypothetical protein
MISTTFVTAGNATLTIEVPTEWAANHGSKPHYTFKVRKKEDRNNPNNSVYFVSILTGPDNTSDYKYVGLLNPNNGSVRTTAKSAYDANSIPMRLLNRSLACVWANNTDAIEAAGFKLHHAGKCGRCGRKLTVPESIETGLGPECAGRV